MIERGDIQALIPHSGNMCLIDRVLTWDDTEVCCSTLSHTRMNNPLRDKDRLSAVHLIEYGAQAMAIHGGLLALKCSAKPALALLAGAKNVRLLVARIDDIETEIMLSANQLVKQGGSMLYSFRVWLPSRELASGRITVIEGE